MSEISFLNCVFSERKVVKIPRLTLFAEMYLNQPDLSILDVALQSGFKSLSTFNRVFKSYKNCTPSEYRKMNRRYTAKPALAPIETE